MGSPEPVRNTASAEQAINAVARTVHVAAVMVHDALGRELLVRKRGTSLFLQPGGKLEPGETAVAAAVRELAEELRLRVSETALHPLGHFEEPAANEPGFTVVAEVFRLREAAIPIADHEIDELAWWSPGSVLPLAPLSMVLLDAYFESP